MYKMCFSLLLLGLLFVGLSSLKQETALANEDGVMLSPFMQYDEAYFGEMPFTPWRALGTATTSLTVTAVPEDSQTFPDTEEATLTLTASEPITGSFEVLPRLVTVDVVGQGVTVLTVSGLLPDTTYHQYLDTYENYTEVHTDAEGVYNFVIDLTEQHVVFIQPHKSTYFLKNDATGGDCEMRGIGTWDVTTLTCTLTQDLTETIQIGGTSVGVADGITLNGNGYGIHDCVQGVYIYNADNVLLKNFSVERCTKGIAVDGQYHPYTVTISNVTTNENYTGLTSEHLKDFTLSSSNFHDKANGLSFNDIDNLMIENVDVTLIPPYVEGNVGDSGITVGMTDKVLFRDVRLDGGFVGLYLRRSKNGDIRDSAITHVEYPFRIASDSTDEQASMSHEIRIMIDDLSYIYTSNRTNTTLDATDEPAVAITCAYCSNTTVKGYTFNHPKMGFQLYKADTVVVENNTFDSGAGNVLQTFYSSGVTIRNNEVHPHVYAPFYFAETQATAKPFEIYNNNIYAGDTQQYVLVSNDRQTFSLSLPIGGNWWEKYDESSEGCVDLNSDKICDTPYSVPPTQEYAKIDHFPWTSASAWDNLQQENGLSFPLEEKYDGVRGVNSGGPYPERGYADREVFTFKTVYTHSANSASDTVEVKIGGVLTIPMHVDSSAQDSLLYDGDYSNGEQYIATTTLQKGSVTYEFFADVAGERYVLGTDSNNIPLVCTAGYSSVAFIPGIKASRLFMNGILFENKLWEPNRDGDARKLALTDEGESENDVYTKVGPEGVLDQVFGVTLNVYKSLLDDLENWKEEHFISDYAVLGYDWRYPYETFLGTGVVNEAGELRFGTQYTTNTPYLYEQLRMLADRSDSGRIIMVGHSMGGLVIKKLLADIEDTPDHPYRDLLGKVDQVVLVASPQLGTPKAVAALLHGMYEELDFPFVHYPDFATNETLRILGKNMPSVYTLLPSKMYFDRVRDVNEEGEEGSYTELILNSTCPTASTYDGMLACFATASSTASTNDLITPLQPRSDYVEYGDTLHERLDNWSPPDMNGDGSPDFKVVQIAGWGINTLSSISYKEKTREVDCSSVDPSSTPQTLCTEKYLDPQPRFTFDGDGTVVLPSAVAMGEENSLEKGVETLYVDAFNYGESLNLVREHAEILEIGELREVIKNLITKKINNNIEYIYSDPSNLIYSKPYMRLALHSPVDIEVFSKDVNRIGKRILPDGGEWYESEIPNSYYEEFGEGKYVGFPVNGESYTVNLTGTASGTFSFELMQEENDEVIMEKTYTNIPVGVGTKATLAVSDIQDVFELQIDIDGDGVVDRSVYPDEEKVVVTYNNLIDELRKLTSPLKISLIIKAHLAKHFDEKGKTKQADLLLNNFAKTFTTLSSNKTSKKWIVSEEDAKSILSIVSKLREKYEY